MTGSMYDVAVVGGGPGGLAAASIIAKKGLKVKVFEKKKVLGTPVRCGEFFVVKEDMMRLLPRVKNPEVFDVPEETIDNKCRDVRVISPRGKAFEFPLASYVLDRRKFETHLAETIISYGGEVEVGVPAHYYPNNGQPLVGPSPDSAIQADIVIAADGYPSETATTAGLPEKEYAGPYRVAVNMEYLMTDLDVEQDVAELYMDPRYSPGGYGWIIPKGERRANVGIGVREPYLRRDWQIRDLLTGFVEKNKVARAKLKGGQKASMIADSLPVDGPLSRTYSERVVAVGDAAGMVMPTNGGGIQTALVTGHLAGEAAVRYFENQTPLSSYEEAWKDQLGVEMENSRLMRQASDRLMGHAFWFSVLLRMMGSRRIADVVMCQMPRGMGPLFRLLA
ncbi:geranylgeranyl reductase family protein [Candidatus Bathyarchaeota archaeon]|nr:MAG: geranylgeranyl reductase family protein [Candidatus Bathyarchaeota archaeon]